MTRQGRMDALEPMNRQKMSGIVHISVDGATSTHAPS